MMQILIPNKITLSRYDHVKKQMAALGAPSIKCIEIKSNYFYALEGSHRITAAKELGFIPNLIVIDSFDDIDTCDSMYAYYQDVVIRESKKLMIEF